MSTNGQLVKIRTEDGRVLNATRFVVPGSPYGAVLLHMYGGKRQDWADLQLRLRAAGISSIAPDYRGNNGSGTARDAQRYGTQYAPLFHKLHLDAFAAKKNLVANSQVNPKAVAYIGASVGTTTSMRACAKDSDCPVIVLLSPGLDYLGVNARPALRKVGKRGIPTLMTFAEREWGEPIAADTLRRVHGGPMVKLRGYDEHFGEGHGTHQFDIDRKLHDEIVRFIMPHLVRAAGNGRR